jgi:N-acyl-D-amino-acid deacylase
VAVGLLRRSAGDVGMVGFAMSEENLERILAHPLAMVCTDGVAYAVDGPTRRGSPHPRGAGSFPRVLGRYVREQGVISLPEAVRKMTSLSAAHVGIVDRGRIAPGHFADLVLFDPATVVDRATPTAPRERAVGIRRVWVNGEVVYEAGAATGKYPGRVVRRR